MFETVYTEHLKGRKVLLETPTGFAVFIVKDFAFEQEKNIWVHFSDPECAIQALFALGFKKVDNKSAAWNGDAGSGKDLVQLINKFCSTGETLIVQDKKLKASIEKKTRIKCRCDGYEVGEVIWGIKNVLHAFIHEEKRNITQEYCLPLSKGLQDALQYYVVNIPPRMVDKTFITKFGFLCYLDMNLEGFPKELSRSFDEYVGIGDTIKDGLDYAKVLAMVLVPDLVEERGFSETFSPDLELKLHQAKLFQANRKDDLTMHDIEKIMGYLDYLMNARQLRDKIIMDLKLMEAAHLTSLEAVQMVDVWEPVDFSKMKFKRVLLETPSGFAIFNVCEDLFCNPKDIWTLCTDILDVYNIVFAIGFVRVDEKSVARNIHDGPGDKLEQLILRFCNANRELVVQDTQLKAVIESKLGVKCRTGDQVVEEVIWGLKYVMPHFILEERNKITKNYFLPFSKQMLKDLETYKINVPTSEITADIINLFGYVKILDQILEKTYKDLRTKCDCYVSDIIVSEDDETYASMIAKLLVPEFKEEIGLPEFAGGLGSKLMDPLKYARKAIDNCDKQEILESLERLSDVRKVKRRTLQKLLEIEVQIRVARMAVGKEAVGKEAVGKEAVGNEAVGKDDEGKTNTKGSNKDGGSGKKYNTEVTNKGKTETRTKGTNKGGRSGKKCKTEVTNKGKTETRTKPMENGRSANKDDRFANEGETKPMENGRSANKGKRVKEGTAKPKAARKWRA